MPNLGAGVDPHYNLTPTGSLVYTPTPGVTATVRVFNEGTQLAFVGQAGITPTNGIPIQPNCHVELPTYTNGASLYACSNFSTTATNTTTSAAANSGQAIVSGLAAATGVTTGSWVQVGSGANSEVVQVSNGTGTGVLGFTAATNFVYDHKSGAAVTVVNPFVASIHVTAGVV